VAYSKIRAFLSERRYLGIAPGASSARLDKIGYTIAQKRRVSCFSPCGMVFNEFSLDWTRRHNLFAGPRMRHQTIRIYKRRPHVACTTGTSAARST
jgi:hypothetical protein